MWSPKSVKWLDCVFPIRLNSNFFFYRQFHRPLDTVSGLLNLSLLYHVWLCGVFLLMTWYSSWILFKIYATEVGIEFFVNAFVFGVHRLIFSRALVSMLLGPKPSWEVGFGFSSETSLGTYHLQLSCTWYFLLTNSVGILNCWKLNRVDCWWYLLCSIYSLILFWRFPFSLLSTY